MPRIEMLKKMILCSLLVAGFARAQDNPTEGCANAIEAYSDGDLELALEEARWCIEGLEQENQGSIASAFKDEFEGYSGGRMENNRSMGMVIIERTYSKDGAAIKVMLTQSAGGGANNPLSALGAISQMGMMGGGRKVRLHGHTGTVMPDNNSAKLMVKPRSGEGMISFESRNVDIDAVISFAKAFMKGYGK